MSRGPARGSAGGGLWRRSEAVRISPGENQVVDDCSIPAENEAMIREDPLCLRSFAHLSELHLRNPSDHRRIVATRFLQQGLRTPFFPRPIPCARLKYPTHRNSRYSRRICSLCGISRKTLERVLTELKQMGAIMSTIAHHDTGSKRLRRDCRRRRRERRRLNRSLQLRRAG